MDKMIVFCACEPQAVTLLRVGFWSSSAKLPTVAFSVRLLELMQNLTMECSVSVKGFVEALRWHNRQTASEV
jgi:CxC1 like cysteine cluster associated with KDZ transposases